MHGKEYRTLHAEWYEAIAGQKDQTPEIDYWATKISEAGGPALELGSGTGRVLVPLLERGIKVIGIDTSEAMTARCLSACRAKGLAPEIYRQSMLDFSLPLKFGLIFLDSAGLGLFESDDAVYSVCYSGLGWTLCRRASPPLLSGREEPNSCASRCFAPPARRVPTQD